MQFWGTPEKIISWFVTTNAISRAILKPAYRFGIPNSNSQTLKSVDFWCKLLSMFLVAKPREWCFELCRKQNSQKFLGFHPWTPLGKAYSAGTDSPAAQRFSPRYTCWKLAPPKNCWIRHWQLLHVEIGQMFRIWFEIKQLILGQEGLKTTITTLNLHFSKCRATFTNF